MPSFLVGSGHTTPPADYATINACKSSEFGTSFGEQIVMLCKGDCGTATDLDVIPADGIPPKIIADGVVYDGSNVNDLPTCDRLINRIQAEISNIKVISGNIFISAMSTSASSDGSVYEDIYIDHTGASGVDCWVLSGTQPNSSATRITTMGGVNGIEFGFNYQLNVTNSTHIQAAQNGVKGSGANGFVKNTFSVDNTGSDYATHNDLQFCASEDGTGTTGLTGYTTAEFVNYPTDLRIKSTSPLATAGEGGTHVGAYVESGGEVLVVDSGSYSQIGTSAGLLAELKIITNSNSYTLIGSEVSLISAKKIILDSGSYNLTGTDVTLVYTPVGGEVLVIDSGLYSLGGEEVILKADLIIINESGNYQVTGVDTDVIFNGLVTASSGNYSLIGNNLNTFVNYGMIVATTSYTLTGTTVVLKYSGDDSQTIGTVTAGFAPDLYSAQYKPSTITVTFKD